MGLPCGPAARWPLSGDAGSRGRPQTTRKGSRLVSDKPFGRDTYFDQERVGKEAVKQDQGGGTLWSTRIILTLHI